MFRNDALDVTRIKANSGFLGPIPDAVLAEDGFEIWMRQAQDELKLVDDKLDFGMELVPGQGGVPNNRERARLMYSLGIATDYKPFDWYYWLRIGALGAAALAWWYWESKPLSREEKSRLRRRRRKKKQVAEARELGASQQAQPAAATKPISLEDIPPEMLEKLPPDVLEQLKRQSEASKPKEQKVVQFEDQQQTESQAGAADTAADEAKKAKEAMKKGLPDEFSEAFAKISTLSQAKAAEGGPKKKIRPTGYEESDSDDDILLF